MHIKGLLTATYHGGDGTCCRFNAAAQAVSIGHVNVRDLPRGRGPARGGALRHYLRSRPPWYLMRSPGGVKPMGRGGSRAAAGQSIVVRAFPHVGDGLAMLHVGVAVGLGDGEGMAVGGGGGAGVGPAGSC